MTRKLSDALEGRYIQKVFSEEGREFLQEQRRVMQSRGFSSSDWMTERNMIATTDSLTFEHLFKHRAVDMKHHTTKGGKRYKRKNHPIHNRMLYGKANDMIYRLKFGFTDAVKDEMRNIELGTS